MKHSMTLCDRLAIMYKEYCSTSNDDLFNMYAHSGISLIMASLDITGFDGYAEIRAALAIFECDLDPSDPAFCHSINLIINSLEMNEFNSHYNDYNLQDEE